MVRSGQELGIDLPPSFAEWAGIQKYSAQENKCVLHRQARNLSHSVPNALCDAIECQLLYSLLSCQVIGFHKKKKKSITGLQESG